MYNPEDITPGIGIERALYIAVPSAWHSDEKGKYLEKIASAILKKQSYEIEDRVRFTGMEIDLLCVHRPSGQKMYAECKFRTNNIGANEIDQCIGQAFRRKLKNIAFFSIGPLGKEAKGAVLELREDPDICFSYYGPSEILASMIDTGLVEDIELNKLGADISQATLLIHPELPSLWLLQVQQHGRPVRIIAKPPHRYLTGLHSGAIREVLDDVGLMLGLPVEIEHSSPVATNQNGQEESELTTEQVSQIVTADSIVDYRPCNPNDFVGRVQLQRELWDYFEKVRQGRTRTRLIALTGASGYGKSSLVAKLSSRFRNIKWRTRFFLHTVDVRSARGPMFVAEALLQALYSARDAGFINDKLEPRIIDAQNILSGNSIAEVLADLEARSRVLILFFDQFEEVFTKDELLSLFNVFKRFALDISARQTNIVIGFSWRTGIPLSDDNPAYQLWHELVDHRLSIVISEFDSAETSKMIGQFEFLLKAKLVPPLRRRIGEQSRGTPWLLKKLCIHVYRQISAGSSQFELLSSRLNVKKLFDEDLEPLTEHETACVRYIAANSPADSIEVYSRFSEDIVSRLVNSRIVVRTGQRFSVYWDIFRDYLTDGIVPSIPWTYVPNYRPAVTIVAISALENEPGLGIGQLSQRIKYTEKTTVNIVTDLQNMALCDRDSLGRYFLAEGVTVDSTPVRARSQFVEHVLYRTLLGEGNVKTKLVRDELLKLVRELYSAGDVKPKTRDKYLNRLLPWLRFCGLAETEGSSIAVFPPLSISQSIGVLPSSRKSPSTSIFLGASPPETSYEVLKLLVDHEPMSRKIVASKGYRNAVQDLSALRLVSWVKDELLSTSVVTSGPSVHAVFTNAIRNSHTVSMIESLLSQHPNWTRREIGTALGERLGKNWKDASAVRNANGLIRYVEYLRGRSSKPKQLDFPE